MDAQKNRDRFSIDPRLNKRGRPIIAQMVDRQPAVLRALAEHIQLQIVGSVSGNQLTIVAGDARIELSLELLREAHGALGALFD